MNLPSDNFRNVFNGYSYASYSENEENPYMINPLSSVNLRKNVTKGNTVSGNIKEGLTSIPTEFSTSLHYAKQNYSDLSSNIMKISSLTNDISGNKFYDYNIPFQLEKKKTVLDGMVHDYNIMYNQNNAVFVLSTITAATLIVFGITLAMK
jgi:hypothetical protein